jgi:hypothetical protein
MNRVLAVALIFIILAGTWWYSQNHPTLPNLDPYAVGMRVGDQFEVDGRNLVMPYWENITALVTNVTGYTITWNLTVVSGGIINGTEIPPMPPYDVPAHFILVTATNNISTVEYAIGQDGSIVSKEGPMVALCLPSYFIGSHLEAGDLYSPDCVYQAITTVRITETKQIEFLGKLRTVNIVNVTGLAVGVGSLDCHAVFDQRTGMILQVEYNYEGSGFAGNVTSIHVARY